MRSLSDLKEIRIYEDCEQSRAPSLLRSSPLRLVDARFCSFRALEASKICLTERKICVTDEASSAAC